MKDECSTGATHFWLERPLTSAGGLPMAVFPLGFIYITVSCIFMFFCAAVWAVTINKSSFSLLREVLLRVFLCSRWRYSDGDTGSSVLVPGGGLRACPTSFIMPSPIKWAAKLHCSGATPTKLSSLACHLVANCWSKEDKSCSPPLHALIALRERERKKERGGGGTRGLFLGMAGHWFYSWVVVCLVFGTGCPKVRWMGSLSAQWVFRDLRFITQGFGKEKNIFQWWNGSYYITF